MTRRGTGRRRARRALLVASGVSLLLAAAVPGARAQAPSEEAGTLPDVFSGSTSASALDVDLVTPEIVPVAGLFDFGVAKGSSTYERSNQTGRSSLVYPGEGLIQGPGLLCGTFLGPQIPPEGEPLFGPIVASCMQYQFPLSVRADSLQPDNSTEGAVALGSPGDPLTLDAGGAHTHAGLDATTTDAQVNDLRLGGLPALGSLAPLLSAAGVETPDTTVLGVDGVTSRTDQRIVGGALVAHAEATVTGLRLLGGLVHVGSVVSTSDVTVTPGAEPVTASNLEVSGVTVAGQPAQVTEDGLVLGGAASGGPLVQQLASQVAAFLQSAGMTFTLLPNEQGVVDGVPQASVGGLMIEYTTPLTGLPPVPTPAGDFDLNGDYGVRLLVGTTGVRGVANAFGGVTGSAPVAGGSTGSPFSPNAGGATSPAGGGAAAPSARPATPAPAAPAATPTPAAPEPAGFFDDLFADRLGFVYLSFTLAAMALCLAPRLTLPARLPTGRS